MNIATKPLLIDANEAFPHRPEADSFDLKQSGATVIAACRNRPRLILATTAVTVLLMLLYILVWPPVYTAGVTMIATSDKDTQREAFYSEWAVFRRDDLKSEVQMFTSGPVLTQVIKRMHLTYNDVYHPPISYATHLWTVSPPGRAWKAIKRLIFPPGPGEPTPEQLDFASTLDDLRSGVSVTQVAESNVGLLLVRGPSRRVKDMADMVVNVYMEQRRDRFAREAQEAYDALRIETDKAHAELVTSEAQMERYFTQSDMLLMFEKDKVEIAQMLAERGSVGDVETQIASAQDELAAIRRELAKEPAEVAAGRTMQNNPIRESMRDKLAQLELARRQTVLRYLPSSPEVQDIDHQIDVLKSQIATQEKESVQLTSYVRSTGYDQLRQREQTLEAQIAGARGALIVKRRDMEQLKQTVDQIPTKMKISHDLGREHDALEKRYMTLQDKLMVAGVSVATAKSAPPSIQVVEYASVPGSASMPKTKLFLLGAVAVGLLAGAALAVLLDHLQGVVNRPRLAQRRAGAPLYGVVSQDPAYADRIFGL